MADTSTQHLKYGDHIHALQSSAETHRYELYKSGDDDLEFAGLINHTLTVQKAEDVTAGVDSALEQLRSSMAAMAELKEANKYASLGSLWHPLESLVEYLNCSTLPTLAPSTSHTVANMCYL